MVGWRMGCPTTAGIRVPLELYEWELVGSFSYGASIK